MLLDDADGSRVRSRARSRVGSHDHKSCDHDVTIAFLFGVRSDKRVIVKNHSQLGKKPPNPMGERAGKLVLL